MPYTSKTKVCVVVLVESGSLDSYGDEIEKLGSEIFNFIDDTLIPVAEKSVNFFQLKQENGIIKNMDGSDPPISLLYLIKDSQENVANNVQAEINNRYADNEPGIRGVISNDEHFSHSEFSETIYPSLILIKFDRDNPLVKIYPNFKVVNKPSDDMLLIDKGEYHRFFSFIRKLSRIRNIADNFSAKESPWDVEFTIKGSKDGQIFRKIIPNDDGAYHLPERFYYKIFVTVKTDHAYELQAKIIELSDDLSISLPFDDYNHYFVANRGEIAVTTDRYKMFAVAREKFSTSAYCICLIYSIDEPYVSHLSNLAFRGGAVKSSMLDAKKDISPIFSNGESKWGVKQLWIIIEGKDFKDLRYDTENNGKKDIPSSSYAPVPSYASSYASSSMSHAKTYTDITELLKHIDLLKYLEFFEENGFTSPAEIKTLTDNDLKDMGISMLGHRRRILSTISEMK